MQTHFGSVRGLISIAFAAAILPTLATIRYVDYTNGADSGDGTSAPGWKTLAYAVANADANDEIVLAKGTHTISSDLSIDKALTIHGVGSSGDTRLTNDNGGSKRIYIKSNGVFLHSLMYYKFGGGYNCQGMTQMTGDSIISNIVFTACGNDSGDNRFMVKISKGILTTCVFTNNLCSYNAGIEVSGSALVENCLFARNTTSNGSTAGQIIAIPAGDTNHAVIRNCTIVDNKLAGASGAVYSYTWNGGSNSRFYNNIVWNNRNSKTDAVQNWSMGNYGDKVRGGWINNCLTPLTNLVAGNGNFEDDPKLDAVTFMPTVASPAAVKSGAKTGTDTAGASYCSACDIDGKPRGATPSVGAFQYVAAGGMSVNVFASKTEVRLPETITLRCETEGAQGALTYAWDFDNDGTVDSTDAEPVLATAGVYASVKVTVSDGTSSKDATYDGTLTILPKFLDVTVSADKTAVRTPGVITLSAAIADEVVAPLTYSWDLNGDGIEDSTDASPVLSTVGTYVNPTLLRVTDADGKYSAKVVLKGTFTILPAEPQTFTVNVGDSFATAVAAAYDGDTILLKKGTHTLSGHLVIDRPIVIKGEGENWETVLDANHKNTENKPHLKITADGVVVNNLTFSRLCGGNYHNSGLFIVTGNSTVSNCVFTGCGVAAGVDNKYVVEMTKGLLTCCWITNNVCRYNPMIGVEGSSIMENCVVVDNATLTEQGNGLVAITTGSSVLRNCTIANNRTTGSKCALMVQYGASGRARAYNNIVYGNTNALGAARNFAFRKWWANDVVCNDIEGKAWGDDGKEYELNSVNPGNKDQSVGKENVSDNPQLGADYAPTAAASASVKSGAKTGTDSVGTSYCTSCDIYGTPRGDKPSMGAIQYVASSKLSAAVNADKNVARPPAVIALKAVVEGAASDDITYAWDIDGDGEFDDGTDSTNVLSKAGTYGAVRVRVSDGVGTVTAAYDGALTVYLDVAVSADQKKIRQPGVITFSATVGDEEASLPFSYSWDLNGDGIEDSTEANPTLSEIGEYVNPTLLSLQDAAGRRSDKIALTGSYVVLPEAPRTFAVNPGDSLPDVLAQAFDGDTVVLKEGTHDVRSVLTVSRPITIRGEGAKEKTILDANYGNNNSAFWHFDVTASGACVRDLTFTHFGHDSNNGLIRMSGDSVISNVVITSCGRDGNCGNIVQMSAGLLTHSWLTNNIAGYCAGIQMYGNSTVENCAILNNRSTGSYQQGGVLRMYNDAGIRTVRNCTIVGNTFAHTNNAAIYGYCWDAAKESVRLYNNIVWGNTCTKVGALHPNAYNAANQKWYVKNNCWDYEDAAKLQDPDGGKDYGNVNADPKFDAKKGAPRLAADSPCRNAGADAYAPTGPDIFGKPRRSGRHVDIGCAELAGSGLSVIVR